MQTILKILLTLGCLAGCGKPAEEHDPQSGKKPDPTAGKGTESRDISKELSCDQARELIPRAASLSKPDFLDILDSPPMQLGEIKNQSLTAILLAVDPFLAMRQNPHVWGDFRYLPPVDQRPNPQLIRVAIMGQPDAEFVSIIQPDYITDCTCQNRGKTARGRVDYRAGNLYAGSAGFTARRQGEEWEIVEFHLPEYRLVTERQPDGRWRLVSEEQLLGIAAP